MTSLERSSDYRMVRGNQRLSRLSCGGMSSWHAWYIPYTLDVKLVAGIAGPESSGSFRRPRRSTLLIHPGSLTTTTLYSLLLITIIPFGSWILKSNCNLAGFVSWRDHP